LPEKILLEIFAAGGVVLDNRQQRPAKYDRYPSFLCLAPDASPVGFVTPRRFGRVLSF